MKKIVALFFLVMFVSNTFGSGFQINEHGARAMGMAGAFTGLANDPSAVYFNPAGIVQLRGTHFSIGSTFIMPSSQITGPTPLTTESKLKSAVFTPINFYFTQEITPDLFVGFGVNNPWGLGTTWEDDWVGKYMAVETEIRTFNFSPVIAYKLTNELSAAVGFNVFYSDVIIARNIEVIVPTGVANPPIAKINDAKIRMEGEKLGYGFNAALFFQATKCLSMGLSFKSNVKLEYEGTAEVTPGANTPPAVVAQLPKGAITAPLNTPMVVQFGLAHKFFNSCNENFLTLAADFQYNGWSSYDKLEITFSEFLVAGQPYVSTSTRDYKNSWIARLGAEYMASEMFTVRGGLLYDTNPVSDEKVDPTLPDADRLGINLGLSYQITDNLSVDFAYLYLMFMERTVTTSKERVYPNQYHASLYPNDPVYLNGTFKSSAHLIGLNFNYGL